MRQLVLFLCAAAIVGCGSGFSSDGGDATPEPTPDLTRYRIELESATFAATKADGSPWDADGVPDPCVLVFGGDDAYDMSRIAWDEFDAYWGEYFEYVDFSRDELQNIAFTVNDEDPPGEDDDGDTGDEDRDGDGDRDEEGEEADQTGADYVTDFYVDLTPDGDGIQTFTLSDGGPELESLVVRVVPYDP